MSDQHVQWCPMRRFGRHTDAAKRVSDAYNLHKMADQYGSIRKWIACRLDDGTSDGVLYDSKRDAVIHQHHNEQYYTFLRISPASATACEMEVMLATARRYYEAGLRMTDPDDKNGGKDIVKRVTVEDQLALSKGKAGNLIIPGWN